MGNGHNEVFGVQSPMGLHLGPVSCVGKGGKLFCCLESFHALLDIEGDISRFQCPRCFVHHQTSVKGHTRYLFSSSFSVIYILYIYLIFDLQGLTPQM